MLRWFRDTFETHLMQETKTNHQDAYIRMEAECPKAPTSLVVVPHFAGSGTPYMDSLASGTISGLRLDTSKAEIYKACMEGLCFEMQLNTDLLSRINMPLNQMNCVGGGAHSDLLLQIKADIMGIPVSRLRAEESGTYGLAMLCATACGEASTMDEAAEKLVKIEKVFHPDPTQHAIYNERYEAYKNYCQKFKRIN